MQKTITAECHSCESSYDIAYVEEITSAEYPEFCPFCGEVIEEIVNYIQDDDFDENEEWDN
jgi:NAD-dependent SIR2 family protein deacetylase